MIALLAAAAVLTPCALPPGWAAVAARRTPVVVFGELHGTAQAPALVGDVVCALAARGDRVLVALEQDASDDAALGAALSLSEEKDVRLALPQVLHWQGLDDGRGSEAMLALLLRLYRLRRAGRQVDLVAFNGPRDRDQADRWRTLPGQGPHEAEQADNIARAAAAKPYDQVIVLVGNLHAARQPVERRGVTFQPMAMRLAATLPVTSLDMAWSSGTAWDCIMRPDRSMAADSPIAADNVECGPRPTRGWPGITGFRSVGLGRPGSMPSSDLVFDGYFTVGAITASPPVLATP